MRERDAPMNRFALGSALSLALDPGLTPRDRLLDDDTLFQAVKADWVHRLPRTPRDGRPSTPVEVILRRLLVKPLEGWSDEATERWVRDSRVVRQVCRGYGEPGPDETTLLRGANLSHPAPLQRRRDHVVVLAPSLKGTHGRTLRIDGTVVETNRHHPTDRTWLDDGGRVRSRTLATATRAGHEAPTLARHACRDRPRSANRPMKSSMEAARQRGAQVEDRRRTAYQRLRPLTTTLVTPAEPMGTVLIDQGAPLGRTLAPTRPRLVPLGQQGMTQTPRRLRRGEAVPAPAQVVSLVAPQTAMIRTGKPGRPTACGRGLWREEVDGGLIRRYAVLEDHAAEAAPLPPSLDHQLRVFQRPPRQLAGERGGHTAANER